MDFEAAVRNSSSKVDAGARFIVRPASYIYVSIVLGVVLAAGFYKLRTEGTSPN